MRKVRTTLTLDEEVMRLVKARAARQSRSDSEVIEESLRRDLGLELHNRQWSPSSAGTGRPLAQGRPAGFVVPGGEIQDPARACTGSAGLAIGIDSQT